jgi:membrane protease subunit HflK
MSTPLDPLPPKPSGSSDAGGTGSGAPGDPSLMPEDAGSQALSEALRSSFVIVKVIMILLVVVFFASGVFTVPSQERAIVLRFGRPVGGAEEEQLLNPGLHWSFPYPIDEIVRIPISTIQTVTSTTGWYYVAPGEEDKPDSEAQTASLNPASDGYTLTGDGNIIHVRAVLRYRINDPLKYTLNFVNASNVLQNALDNALIHASAEFSVDQVLYSDKQAFKERILQRVRQLVDQQTLGVNIDTADIPRQIPPRQGPVKNAFTAVALADFKRQQTLDEARTYYNSNVLTAESEAAVILNNAETEKAQLLQAIASEARYFTNQLPYYRSDPELFQARLQTETIGRTLTNAEYKVLRVDGRTMRVLVNREAEKPPTPTPTR